MQDGDWRVAMTLKQGTEDREYLIEGQVNEKANDREIVTYNGVITAKCNNEWVCPAFQFISHECSSIGGGMLQQRIICNFHLLQGYFIIKWSNGDLNSVSGNLINSLNP